MDVLEYIAKEIEDKRKNLEYALSSGGAADFASYQNMVGKCAGLAMAQAVIVDLIKRTKEDDDE